MTISSKDFSPADTVKDHENEKRNLMGVASNAKVLQFGKKCPRCEQVKPAAEFYSNAFRYGDGFSSRCRSCDTEYQRARKRAQKPRAAANKKAYNFNATLKSRYGITADDARELLKRQFGLCANRGCGKPLTFDVDRRAPDRVQVDHCHKTGNVRGILCRRCNTSAAVLETNENVYLGLIEYVSHYAMINKLDR